MSRNSERRASLGALMSSGRLEFLRFAAVGGMTYVIDTAVFLSLKSAVLDSKPITAKAVAVIVATGASYLLNRGWSFRRRRRHGFVREFLGYGTVAAVALLLAAAPLAVSRYVFDLATPTVGVTTEHVADFVSAQIIGTALGMAFRWWAFRKWIFPSNVGTVIRSTSQPTLHGAATVPPTSPTTTAHRLPTGRT